MCAVTVVMPLYVFLDLLRGITNGYGTTARLCQRRMGPDKGYTTFWPDTHNTSGEPLEICLGSFYLIL